MKRLVIPTATVASLIALAYVYLFVLEPDYERPEGVQEYAHYFGGVDGGYWIEPVTVDETEKLYRFRIYRHGSGTLVLDADYEQATHCQSAEFNYFRNYPEDMRSPSSQDYAIFLDTEALGGECRLEVVYPAHGGTLWEVERVRERIKEQTLDRQQSSNTPQGN